MASSLRTVLPDGSNRLLQWLQLSVLPKPLPLTERRMSSKHYKCTKLVCTIGVDATTVVLSDTMSLRNSNPLPGDVAQLTLLLLLLLLLLLEQQTDGKQPTNSAAGWPQPSACHRCCHTCFRVVDAAFLNHNAVANGHRHCWYLSGFQMMRCWTLKLFFLAAAPASAAGLSRC